MPKTIRFGSQGPEVLDLQTMLNCIPPSQFPNLAIDGLFGPKTNNRVKEFQRDCELTVDGVVGPITWEELGAWITIPPPVAPRCANCHPQNAVHVNRVQQAFMPVLRGQPQGFASSRSALASDTVATLKLPGVNITAAPLTSLQRSVANARFGNSLDLDCIFITDQAGAEGRPFTLTIPLLPGMPRFGAFDMVILLNMGTLQPNGNDFVHELAHAWQAQHHVSPKQYMANSIESQGLALIRNAPLGVFDSAVRAHKNFPVLFPFSPYAYVPGKGFGAYCAEQIAQQVEHNESAIVDHVRAATPGIHDRLNGDSLSTARAEDRRNPGVK